MKLLALDSSGLVASVAVLENDTLLAEYTINYKKTHSQTLLPMLETVGRMIDLDLNSIDAIAVAAGPGSFTGLRIGAATAKGLGLALDKPLVGVPTTKALAYNLFEAKALICPILDARRNQVYTGVYQFEKGVMKTIMDQKAVDILQLLELLNKKGQEVIFLGDGVLVYRQIIEEKCLLPYSFAPAHLNKQRAAAVGALAMIYYAEGKVESAAQHQPEYLRVSQAERERVEKLRKIKNGAD